MEKLDIENIQEETLKNMKVAIDKENEAKSKNIDALIETISERIKKASSEGKTYTDFNCLDSRKYNGVVGKYNSVVVNWLEESGFYVVCKKDFWSYDVDLHISWHPKDIKKIGPHESWIHRVIRHNNYISVINFFSALASLFLTAGIIGMTCLVGYISYKFILSLC